MVGDCRFRLVQHLERGLDCGLRLVCVQASGSPNPISVTPGDDCLDERVRPSAGRNADSIVVQERKLLVQLLTIDLAERLHEGVILAIAGGIGFILHASDVDLDTGKGLQSIRREDHVADQLHLVFQDVVLQHVVDDVGQVLLRDQFLLVSQLRDTLGDGLGLL